MKAGVGVVVVDSSPVVRSFLRRTLAASNGVTVLGEAQLVIADQTEPTVESAELLLKKMATRVGGDAVGVRGPEEPYLLSVGGMPGYKNLEVVLEALARLRERGDTEAAAVVRAFSQVAE